MNSIAHPHVVPALSFSLDGHQVRVVIINDEPWFVAADVCAFLEIRNVTQAVNRLDEDERAMFNIGEAYVVNIISEAGFYSLAMGSRKPEAKRFKRWVTHEVIPSIRKTGSYSVQKQVPNDRQRKLCRMLVHDVLKCDDAFGRANFIALLKASMEDAGLQIQDIELLRPLPVVNAGQLDLLEGGAA